MWDWIKKEWLLVLTISLVLGYFIIYQPVRRALSLPPVISTGVSTDGRYVITAHSWRDMNANFDNNVLVLWDAKDKSKQIIDKNVNPFSAYFIPDSHEFMWQDNDDIVHIQNVEGKETLSFKHIPIMTHIMSADKQTYLSTTPDWWIYSGYGDNKKLVLNDDFGSSKPLNLSLSGDYFLTVGNGIDHDPIVDRDIKDNPIIHTGKVPANFHHSITIWQKYNLHPIIRIRMHNGKTFAIFSPDGQWIISGDESGHNYMWSIDNLDKPQLLAEAFYGIHIPKKDGKPSSKDNSKLLSPPPELKDRVMSDRTVAYAFLTETDFVHLGHTYGKKSKDSVIPLYTVGDPWIKGYLDLQEKPRPSLDYYSKSLTVASSYKAHVLVTGQAYQGGINVYQYHPDKKELERIWVGDDWKYW